MKYFKYCPHCRRDLEEKHIEGRDRYHCPDCGWINYLNPLPVMSCLVVNRKKQLLLIRRGIEPMIGSWALPGGFIELEESPEHAGKRELMEETGLDGRPGRLVSVLSHMSVLYGPLIMIGYEYLIDSEDTAAGDDAQDARFFPFDSLPEIPFDSHRILIDKFKNLL